MEINYTHKLVGLDDIERSKFGGVDLLLGESAQLDAIEPLGLGEPLDQTIVAAGIDDVHTTARDVMSMEQRQSHRLAVQADRAVDVHVAEMHARIQVEQVNVGGVAPRGERILLALGRLVEVQAESERLELVLV